jgi:hypothetical protein
VEKRQGGDAGRGSTEHFRYVLGLAVEQFKSSKGWEKAYFRPAFQRELKAAKEKEKRSGAAFR